MHGDEEPEEAWDANGRPYTRYAWLTVGSQEALSIPEEVRLIHA